MISFLLFIFLFCSSCFVRRLKRFRRGTRATCVCFPCRAAKVVKEQGMDIEGLKLYLASDRQRPDADKTFEKKGSISYDRGNKKDKYYGDGTHFVTGYTGVKVFEPAVDMFMLVVGAGSVVRTFHGKRVIYVAHFLFFFFIVGNR